MTTQADGSTRCDRCGTDCQNGGVDKVVVISGLLAEGGRVVNLHLCTFEGRLPGVDGRSSPPGEKCASRVLTRKALAYYVEHVGEPGEMVRLYKPQTREDVEAEQAAAAAESQA